MLDRQRLLSLRRYFGVLTHLTPSGTSSAALLSSPPPFPSPFPLAKSTLPCLLPPIAFLPARDGTHFLPVSFDVVRPCVLPLSLLLLVCFVLYHRKDPVEHSHAKPSLAVHSPGPPSVSVFGKIVQCQSPSEGTTKLSFQFEDEPVIFSSSSFHMVSWYTGSNRPPILTLRMPCRRVFQLS